MVEGGWTVSKSSRQEGKIKKKIKREEGNMFFLRRRLEYKEYLEISDREWYSKRYYKKLIKSGQLEEE